MPQVNFADPRLTTPQYGNILPSLAQGFQFSQQVQDAPIRQKLAQIQLQREQEQLAMAPLREQLAQIQLADAQKRAAVPEWIAGDVTLENAVSPYDYPALDENGNRTAPMPLGDLVQITEGQQIGPGGVMTPFTQRKTLKTAADREAAAEAAKALNDYRGDLGQAAITRAQNAAGKIALGKKLSQGVNPATGTLVVTVQNPDGSIEQVDTGQIAPPTLAEQILGGLGAVGGKGPTNLAQSPVMQPLGSIGKPPRFQIPAGTVDEPTQALISQLAGAFDAGVASKPTTSYATLADAQAAAAAGTLKKGTKITIGGVPGTWQ